MSLQAGGAGGFLTAKVVNCAKGRLASEKKGLPYPTVYGVLPCKPGGIRQNSFVHLLLSHFSPFPFHSFFFSSPSLSPSILPSIAFILPSLCFSLPPSHSPPLLFLLFKTHSQYVPGNHTLSSISCFF